LVNFELTWAKEVDGDVSLKAFLLKKKKKKRKNKRKPKPV
jgi:hypothetical protein